MAAAMRSLLVLLALLVLPRLGHTLDAEVRSLVLASDWAAMKTRGPGLLPALVELYRATPEEEERTRIAHAFYQLGWESEDARRALSQDVHTANPTLRISVQYALGRVSNDDAVVDTLLANMRNDPNPLFRDKAACALAYDQIHLTEAQKVRLYAGLIHALGDDKDDVRAIAIKALEIHTGQTKGYSPGAPPPARAAAIAEWDAWLARYRENLR
jgi:HEAT repeat protein